MNNMDNILPTEDFVEVEGRYYANPQTGLDESNQFIEQLRATQGQQNQEIAEQTQRLGTDVPTNLGGLTGADSYFTSRYQTPMTNAAVANLRATAQAKALNDVLANEQAIWKNRYQQAYRDYQKRQYNRARRASGGGGGGTTGGTTQVQSGGGNVTTTPTDERYAKGELTIDEADINRGGHYVQSMDVNRYGGHDIIWVTPDGRNITIPQLSDGSYATGKISDLPGLKNVPFLKGK